MAGDYAFVAAGRPEVEIVDISDPENPFLATTLMLDFGSAYHLSIQDNYLLVAHYDLTVADITNPREPTILATYIANMGELGFRDVTAKGQYIYSYGGSTFAVFEFPTVGVTYTEPELPRRSPVLQAYPNPFNSSAAISYSIPAPGHVALSIYNILGQRVVTLFSGVQQAGVHKVVWNAEGVPSGVYFARLESGEGSKSIKMVVLK